MYLFTCFQWMHVVYSLGFLYGSGLMPLALRMCLRYSISLVKKCALLSFIDRCAFCNFSINLLNVVKVFFCCPTCDTHEIQGKSREFHWFELSRSIGLHITYYGLHVYGTPLGGSRCRVCYPTSKESICTLTGSCWPILSTEALITSCWPT